MESPRHIWDDSYFIVLTQWRKATEHWVYRSFEWAFFSDHLENCCKIRGLGDDRLFFGCLFWWEVLERFWRREKVDYFQCSESIPPSE